MTVHCIRSRRGRGDNNSTSKVTTATHKIKEKEEEEGDHSPEHRKTLMHVLERDLHIVHGIIKFVRYTNYHLDGA